MTNPVSIALAQLNAHLGNIDANISRLAGARAKAAANGAEIIVTPEMYLSGYPCDDLVLRDDFMNDIAIGIDKLAALTSDGGQQLQLVHRAKIAAEFIIRSLFSITASKLPVLTRSICQIMACLMISVISPRVRCLGQLCFVD